MKVDSKVVQSTDNWTYSFDNLAKYNDGKIITYTITEESVVGYSTEIKGNDLINTRTHDQTSVTVTKSWLDNNNQDGIRPNSIKVQLYADGQAVGDTVTLNAGNKWTTTFNHLDLNAKGKAIEYAVKEVGEVKGYTTTIDNSNKGNVMITNTHTPETPITPTNPSKPNNNGPSLPKTNEVINNLYGLIGFILISIGGFGWVLAKKK